MKTLFALAFILSSSCSHRATIDFAQHQTYLNDVPGMEKFQDIGVVRASAGGFFADCQEMAEEAMRKLQDETKARGGELTYKVRFRVGKDRHDYTSLEPMCKRNIIFRTSSYVMGIAAKSRSVTDMQQASERASKCKDKGGEWVEGSCRIKVD